MTDKNDRLSTPRPNKREHRLSQAYVRVTPLKDSQVVATKSKSSTPRTRNALVAEFQNTNVMTRNRKSIDQMKSPTQRLSLIKRLTNARTSSPSSPSSQSTNSSPSRRQSNQSDVSFLSLSPSAINKSGLSPSPPAVSKPKNGLKRGRPSTKSSSNSTSDSSASSSPSRRVNQHKANTPASPKLTPAAKRRANASSSTLSTSTVPIRTRKSVIDAVEERKLSQRTKNMNKSLPTNTVKTDKKRDTSLQLRRTSRTTAGVQTRTKRK